MIVGIINGYYRSGTTFMQRLCSKSNPNFIVLSEPTQHEIIDHIMANGCNNTNILHEWEIFKDYCKLPRKVLHEFIRRHFTVFDENENQWGIMTSEGAIRYLLQPLHDFEKQVVIKSTQLHLFLEKVKRWYDCWILHLDRSIENIIADHFTYYALINSNQAKELLTSNKKPLPFYADLVFKNLAKYFDIDEDIARNNLDKLVFNILTVKKVIEKQKGIKVIDFDKFISNPKQYLNEFPFKINESLLKLVNPSKKNPVPDWLKDMVKESVSYIKNVLRW